MHLYIQVVWTSAKVEEVEEVEEVEAVMQTAGTVLLAVTEDESINR